MSDAKGKRKLSHTFGRAVCGTLVVSILGAGAWGGYTIATTVSPPSAGITYLENHGFTDVTPTGDVLHTGHLFYTGCPKGTRARSYTAIDKQKEKVTKTLCFGVNHKIYTPS